MIVYYTKTTYQVMCATLHRIAAITSSSPESKDDATLLVADSRGANQELLDRLTQSKVFTKVFSFPNKLLQGMGVSLYGIRKSPRMLNDAHDLVCQMFPKYSPIEFKKDYEYYISPDYCSAGIYLAKNKIPYNYMEDGCGVLSRPELLIGVLRNSPYAVDTINALNLNGQSELVKSRIGDASSQVQGYVDDKMVDFSVTRELKNLSKENRKIIMSVFSGSKEKIGSNDFLLLTQPFTDRKILSMEGQREMFALLMDYFAEGSRIHIKPHPGDIVFPYKEMFPDTFVYSASMPSELMQYKVRQKYKFALSVSSTSVYSMFDTVEKATCLNVYFEDNYKIIHQYFLFTKVLKLISAKGLQEKIANYCGPCIELANAALDAGQSPIRVEHYKEELKSEISFIHVDEVSMDQAMQLRDFSKKLCFISYDAATLDAFRDLLKSCKSQTLLKVTIRSESNRHIKLPQSFSERMEDHNEVVIMHEDINELNAISNYLEGSELKLDRSNISIYFDCKTMSVEEMLDYTSRCPMMIKTAMMRAHKEETTYEQA